LQENPLTLYHELQEDVYFRENPHLLEFKKPNYIDPDILAARRAGKGVFTNKLIKDKHGYEFGCKSSHSPLSLWPFTPQAQRSLLNFESWHN